MIDGLGASGGAERRLVEEVLALTGRAEQSVVRLFEPDELDADLGAAGIPVHPLGLRAGRASYSWPLVTVRLYRLIGRTRPAVVHTSLFHADLAGQLAARARRVPVVSTMTGAHYGLAAVQGGGWRGTAARRAARLVGRWSGARWRAVADEVKRDGVALLGADPGRVRVIERGVDPARFGAAASRADLGVPAGVPLVVNVARHAPMKGHLALLDAFAAILAARPDAHLVIAGKQTAHTPAIVARIGELHLGDRVHLLGFRADAGAVMAAGDVFVFPSSEEGFGASVVEAVVAGVPVVAYDIPSIREVTGGGAVAALVAPGDTAVLAAAALAALELRAQPAALAERRQWVLDRYSVDQAATRLLDLLEEVAATRRR